MGADDLDAYYASVRDKGIVNISGGALPSGRFARLLNEARDPHGRDSIRVLLASGTTIDGDLTLDIPVSRFATFEGAHFTGEAHLRFEAACPVNFDEPPVALVRLGKLRFGRPRLPDAEAAAPRWLSRKGQPRAPT